MYISQQFHNFHSKFNQIGDTIRLVNSQAKYSQQTSLRIMFLLAKLPDIY